MDAAKGPGRGFGEFWRLLASFDGWQTAPLNHVKVEFRGWTGLWTLPEGQASLGSLGQGCGSTPPVVPGAAPALAKAGVGGFRCINVANISNDVQNLTASIPTRETNFSDPCPVSWQVPARGFDDLWKRSARESWPQHKSESISRQLNAAYYLRIT